MDQSSRQTTAGPDQSMISEMEQALPTAKRQQDRAEYERRKQEEEEMKRMIEEERQRQLDQYGGVEDNLKAIPIQKILEFKMKKKQESMQESMSRTMMSQQNLNQPVISGNTLMGTSMQTGLARTQTTVGAPQTLGSQ